MEIIDYMKRAVLVQIKDRMRGRNLKMDSMKGIPRKGVRAAHKLQRKVVATGESDKAVDRVGAGMTWAAGLSMFYVLGQWLRWVNRG